MLPLSLGSLRDKAPRLGNRALRFIGLGEMAWLVRGVDVFPSRSGCGSMWVRAGVEGILSSDVSSDEPVHSCTGLADHPSVVLYSLPWGNCGKC